MLEIKVAVLVEPDNSKNELLKNLRKFYFI